MKCPICDSNNLTMQFDLYDDRYGYPGIYALYRCNSCRHRAVQTDFDPETLGRLYTDYYPRSKYNTDQYRPSKIVKGFESFLNGESCSAYSWVPKDVRVLDIGCGFCETLGYHKARGCDVYGVEADENARRVADRFGFNVHIGLFDPSLYQENYFDYVTLDQVIEHVITPLETMRGIARVLKPGGIAVLSTPNANGLCARLFKKRWINWHVPYHMQYFSIDSMRVASERTGLSLYNYRTITNSAWLHFQWMHLVTYPDLGKPSGFWSHYGIKSDSEKLMMDIFSMTHRAKINHLITRILDMSGIGDNYLFFLRKD